ncbi:methyltransferase domain-containing protein [Rhabdochromatium marinum]|uniref:methyltransferase domain-containing protein n=1 Tax=Rhabdochromatium marinum TaxID=48729 RepID=UPI0019077E42|nr:methyltransferase domain-containing protein [Rhabdochromatium marinum]MBK1650165.1 SAM-dependent methyltransferase [Rhabdochromatium marinum]
MKNCDAPPADPLTALDHWYRSPLGQRVAATEARCLEELLEDAFGYYLLQVGAQEPFAAALEACRIRQQILLQTTDDGPRTPGAVRAPGTGDVAPLRAELMRLPFAADSLDAVVLPHSLDFSPDPHRVLREVERVLIAEGRVFLFGFNPFSTWGVRRVWPRRRGMVPWCGSRLTLLRVCDWLKLMGFHIEVKRMLVFRPPWCRAFNARLDWVDSLGQRYGKVLGGVYAVRAVKRLSTLTPLRSRWKPRPSLLPTGRAVKPTARESSHD